MSEAAAAKITHVIFDLDGLLIGETLLIFSLWCDRILHNWIVDTECLYTQETQKIVSRYGKTYDWTLKSKLMGRKPINGATILVDELQIPLTPAEFHSELYGNLMDKFPDAPFLPCASGV